ncbi:hypothetical protein SAMN03159341_14318 [Paenibacillus sp. 1_12]|nr:hypothetical protein SAMN03159341_14318 [Paenibacillus sp. 1_12]
MYYKGENKGSTTQHVRIVRFANEGFDIKQKRGALSIYETEVFDFWSEYKII